MKRVVNAFLQLLDDYESSRQSFSRCHQFDGLKFLKSGTAISGKSPRPSNHCVEDEDWAIEEVKRWASG